ncbi:C40 family peptidase [Pedobacter sp. SD-b]|uniref:C40 family peptidase n=1 Tax=Pedobacter segetis TaxID=2793069 RepID=A0ABS1BFK0_9SPHI|nr:NlpC/P60 family protein [Pedobacter segetis]MBK0381631.1 C40 family peptidase [Pedobacter segetis]
MNKKHHIFFCIIVSILVVLSSCKSKKNTLKNANYKIEKPSNKIAAKYAEEMDVSKSDIKNGKLYEFIDDWEGTRYEFGGLTKKGIDCSGLVYLIYQNVYDRQIPRSTSQQVNIIKRKYENQLKEGDLVFFDFDGKKFSHVGLYLQNGYYVHASTRKGVMLEKLRNPYTYKYFSRGGSVE